MTANQVSAASEQLPVHVSTLPLHPSVTCPFFVYALNALRDSPPAGVLLSADSYRSTAAVVASRLSAELLLQQL